jgi:zinc protease
MPNPSRYRFLPTACAAAIISILAVSVVAATTPAAGAPLARVTSVEGITEYRLGNGLRVLLFPDQSKQTITP